MGRRLQDWEVHDGKSLATKNPVVECRLCESCWTESVGTKLCDPCWELQHRIRHDPESARKVLEAME